MDQDHLDTDRQNWGMIILIVLCFLLILGVFISLLFAFSASQSSQTKSTEFAILEETHQALGTQAAGFEETLDRLGTQAVNLETILADEEHAHSTAEALSEEYLDSAERYASTSKGNRLAADALAVFEETPPLGLLLAIEAVNATLNTDGTPSTKAEEALRNVLSRSGGEALLGHHEPINDLTLSPDGHWLYSTSRDGSIRLWDLSSENPSSSTQNLSCLGEEQYFVRVSPDGRWLATGGNFGSLCLWKLNQGSIDPETIYLQGFQGSLQSLEFHPGSDFLFAADSYGFFQIWDLTEPEAIANVFEYSYPEGSLSDADISEDFTFIAATTYESGNFLLDVTAVEPTPIPLECPIDFPYIVSISSVHSTVVIAGDKKTCLLNPGNLYAPPTVSPEYDENIRDVALSPDGNWFVVTTADNLATLWKMQDFTQPPLIHKGHECPIIDLAFTSDSKHLITAGGDGKIFILDLTISDPTQNARLLLGHDDPIYSLDITDDSQLLVSGGLAGVIRIWNLDSQIGDSWVITEQRSRSLAISPDSQWLLTSHDTTLQLWDLTQPNSPPMSYQGFNNSILSADFSSTGEILAVGSWDETLHFWDPFDPNWTVDPTVLEADNGVTLVEVSPSGRWLLYNVGDRIDLVLMDLHSQDQFPMSLPGLTSDTKSAEFSPNEKWLAAGTSHGEIFLWDLTQQDPFSQAYSLGSVRLGAAELIFSQDDRFLIAQERDTLLLWDLSIEEPPWEPYTLEGHVEHLTDVALSQDDQWIAASSIHGPIALWNINELSSPKYTMNHHAVDRIAFSPDGNWLASGGQDDLVRLWNLRSENPSVSPIILEGHEDMIYNLAFTPDGNWLISASSDSVRAWSMSLDNLLSKACAFVGRNLTYEEWQVYMGEEPYRATCAQYPLATPVSYEPTPLP